MAGHSWFSISLTAWVSMHRLGVHGDEETQAESSTYPALRVVVLVKCNYHLRFVYICSLYLPFCGTQVLLAVDKRYIYDVS